DPLHERGALRDPGDDGNPCPGQERVVLTSRAVLHQDATRPGFSFARCPSNGQNDVLNCAARYGRDDCPDGALPLAPVNAGQLAWPGYGSSCPVPVQGYCP